MCDGIPGSCLLCPATQSTPHSPLPVIDWGKLLWRPRFEKTLRSCQLFVLLFYNCGQCHMSGSRLGAWGHKSEWLFNGVSCQRLKTQ